MRDDPIVRETRAAREELLKCFNYDLDALCAFLEQQEAQNEKKAVTLEPKRPASTRKVP